MSPDPKAEYKPLFNRSYLKYLGFIVAIAIVILSEKASSPLDQPTLLINSASKLHVLTVENIEQQRLFLSFQSYPALSQSDKISRRLAYQALRKNAKNIPNIHAVLWTYDRLEIELRWRQNDTDTANISLGNTLQALFQIPPQLTSKQQRKIIGAKHYLENKKADTALLTALDTGISSQYKSPTQLSNILDIAPTILLISNESSATEFIQDLNEQIIDQFSKHATDLPESLNWQAKRSTITQRNNRHNLLIASELLKLSNLQSKKELLANFVLGKILNKELKGQNVQFRLVKQQIFARGYQSVLLSSNELMTDSLINIIESKINNANFDKELTIVKQRLIKQYHALANDQERLFRLYSKKQFYRLPTQSASEYEEQIDTIDEEQVRSLMRRFISEPTYTIFLQPS